MAECVCLSPSAPQNIAELAFSYHLKERLRRALLPDSDPSTTPTGWSAIGRPMAVAVGLMRLVLERAPNSPLPHETIALVLWEYGLEAEAMEAVRRSAWALPVYEAHRYRDDPELPAVFRDTFADELWIVLRSMLCETLPGTCSKVKTSASGNSSRNCSNTRSPPRMPVNQSWMIAVRMIPHPVMGPDSRARR